jgi:5-oxoprolinase (ATP-hydrolysing)
MHPGNTIDGPAIVIESNATTVIEPEWTGRIDSDGQLVLSRQSPRVRKPAMDTEADPIMLEVFNKRFMAIAEQMGHTLQNTALSVNIKERLDFSCAIFDTEANLIANAPHIPVHLGSMGESVRTLISGLTNKFSAGNVYMLNSPFHGGTHLPDITVVTPVFDPPGSTLLFFVASRGHHADIGGSSPGSMPPDSQTIDQEGIWTTGLKLVENGTFLEKELSDWLSKGPLPARKPDQNIADLKAQIAANEKGSKELLDLVSQYGAKVVHAYMRHIQDNAEEAVRRVIRKLKSGNYLLKMDNGAHIAVGISVDRQEGNAHIDFTGTSQQQSNNFNAPSAVVKAAVLYVFRTLVDDDIPLNAGCLRPLQIIIPEASMLNPQLPAAVVAGNVETSQCIVDALYGALGVLAGSQGTMNNLTFGNRDYQYYETICGGSGAGPDFNGTDAVQTHMTNSRITDPEILESRYPVHLERFEINPSSGGAGKHKGGNGVIREMRFKQQMTAAMLSGFRSRQPAGIDGGKPGKQGTSRIERADGSVEEMEACFRTEVYPGDRIIVETPGGGGFGRKN